MQAINRGGSLSVRGNRVFHKDHSHTDNRDNSSQMTGTEIIILVPKLVLIIITTAVIEIVLTMLALRGQLDVVETMVGNAVRAQGEEVKPEVAVTRNVDVGNKVDRPK
ncbi:hypothetical protein DPMN_109279 [Dreissena polymorpha]|uniref:Uncharacterized protein n=1 Tax=Dreissena polymorpha TaxID=45954 RepID=A0A9D4KAA0_DREPO|nr:hypothetical protein DPMN_109279 [Dreissena polymorpha]